MEQRTLISPVTLVAVTAVVLLVAGSSCRDYYVVPDGVVGSEDGGSSDGGEGDAPGSSPCTPAAPGVVFCDDFDTTALGATWTTSHILFGSLDRTAFVSAPNSMRVLVPEPSPKEAAEYLSKQLGVPAAANLRVEVSLRIDRESAVYPFGLFCGSSGYALSLNLGGAVVEQGGGVIYTSHHAVLSLPVGRWQKVELTLKRAAGTVELRVGGAVALPETRLAGKDVGGQDLVATGDCRLAMGLFDLPQGLSWDGKFDNVVVTTF